MSIDYVVHLGPYVVCKTEQIDKKDLRQSCPNEKCIFHGTSTYGEFCSACGSKIQQVEFTIKVNKVNLTEMIEKINNDLTPSCRGNPGFEIWTSNLKRKGINAREFSFYPTTDFCVNEITPDMITEELEEFKEQYKEQLKVLGEVYGNLTVKWGCISTAN